MSSTARAPTRFTLSIQATVGKSYVPFVRRSIRRAWKLVRRPPTELSVQFTDDRTMSRLHRRFMNVAGPTDVLTFPMDIAPDGRVISGEVVICVPQARRQAKKHEIPVERELLLYALHGLLHLSGFDDRTESDFRRMHALEDDILIQIGVGPAFKPQPRRKRAAAAAGARG
jgi:probable rRNA maturation factor